MIGAPISSNRFFCGRIHRRPLLIALLDRWGWHKELYRVIGELEVRTRWVKSRKPGHSIYTCRRQANHPVLTLKQEGHRKMNQITITNTVKRGRRPMYTIGDPVPTVVRTGAWELGHKYEFTRWEET
jgi:hypothetical protein